MQYTMLVGHPPFQTTTKVEKKEIKKGFENTTEHKNEMGINENDRTTTNFVYDNISHNIEKNECLENRGMKEKIEEIISQIKKGDLDLDGKEWESISNSAKEIVTGFFPFIFFFLFQVFRLFFQK